MEWKGQMNAWNLKRKITFFLTLVILVTSIVIMLISTISAAYYMMRQSKDMAKSQLDTMVSNYDDTLGQYQNLAVAMVIESSVQRYCKSASNVGAEYEQEAGNVYNFLMNMLNVRSNMNFAVVKKGDTGRYVYNINFKDNLIEQLHREEQQKLKSELFLVDCNGKIVTISNGERIGKEVSYAESIQGSGGSFQQDGLLINYQKIGKWNYYLIHEIPVFELYKGTIIVLILMLAVTFGMTVFSIMVLRKMINSFYEPMNRVVLAMDDVAEGRLDERIDIKCMDADSRKLAEGFNSMMDEIDTLMEQVKTEQHQIEQIRFNALQSQIKPHFLYNTLECIHWQAVADGNKEIVVMVKAMAQFYRICLSRGKEIIALEEELKHIRSYLIIQNMRYDNIVDLEDRIPQEYYGARIPKMTLQPLIENAIYHGIRVKEGGRGKIILSIRRDEEDICLLLCDSGTGMTQEAIDEMNQSISRYDESFGYGVRNVNKRIELIFGKEYGLHYLKNEHGGITVEIHLPFSEMEREKGAHADVQGADR